MRVSVQDHRALVADLRQLLRVRLIDPLDIVAGEAVPDAFATIASAADVQAEVWAVQLLDGGSVIARHAAARIVAVLYPGDDVFDPAASWWETPLGRAIATRVGHPGAEVVSTATAAAMLGISRQGVADLLRRGKLSAHPDGGVVSASVAHRLSTFDQQRSPRARTDRVHR